MRIAVYSSSFPTLSETFVINQIVGLLKIGVEVDIIADEVASSGLIHESVKEYGLIERVKCFGLPPRMSRGRKAYLFALNALLLLVKGRVKDLSLVLSDNCLQTMQKLNLLYMLNRKSQQAQSYANIICHFGNNGYYVCKLRDLGLVSGPVSTVFHAQEICNTKLITKYMSAYKRLFDCGDLMLPISELWRQRLIDWGCDPKKVIVHRMGIDLNDFKRPDRSPELSTPLRVIQVGRLTEKKAILDSINAVILASKSISIDFTIIGDGELEEDAKQLIKSSNAEAYVQLLGRQPQEVVKEKLSASDVFLLPSVTAKNGDMEGVPVALMEAMANGLIVLSTYHSGIPELVEDGVSGFLVRETQVSELAESMIKISKLSVAQVESIRNRARAKCSEEFNNEKLNQQLAEYF